MKLTNTETQFLKNISTCSGYDISIVRDVFKACLIALTMEMYTGNNTLIIPYVCSLEVNTEKEITGNDYKLTESYQVQSSPSLQEVIKKILNKEAVWVEEFLEDGIKNELNDILEIED